MGVVACGTALGAVLHPIMLNQLFHGRAGFHNGVRISAALNTCLLLVANIIMRTRLPPVKNSGSLQLLEFARDPPYVAIATGSLLVVCGLFFPSFFLQLDAIKHGVDPMLSFYFLSIMNATSIFGRTIPTFYAPRLGVINLLLFFTAGMGVLLFCLGTIKSAGGFAAFSVAFGFVSGGAISLTPPALASLAKDRGELGARIGVSFAISGIIGLFATPIAGALLSGSFHWWRPIIFSASTMLGGACCFLIARTLLVRRRESAVV